MPKFSKDNQPKRRRGKDNHTKMIKVLESQGMTEIELWGEVLKLGLSGDSGALTAFLNRLQPTLKPQSRRIDMSVIDEKWLELSHTSRQVYLAFLVGSGELTIEEGLALSSILSGEAAYEADMIVDMNAAREAADNGDKAEQKSLQRRYELHNQMHDDNVNDINRLREMLKDADTDDSDNNNDDGGSGDDKKQK